MLLARIVRHKMAEVERCRKSFPLEALQDRLKNCDSPRGFARQLSAFPGTAVIAELKRASPSRGVIRPDFPLEELAGEYTRGGAAAISVLTEEHFFQGKPEYMSRVRKNTQLPLLRKDFIVSEYQVYESRIIGADALLFITAVLEDTLLRRLLALSRRLELDALVEVHTREELERALDAGAGLIGINNRDLHTFQVRLETTEELASRVPPGILLVSESGFFTREDILRAEAVGVKAVLVGEALMRSQDPACKLHELRGYTKKKIE